MLWNNRDVDGASKLDPLPWAMAWLRIRNDKFFYKEEKYQINVGSVRVGWLGPCPLPYGNALRIICLYVVNLALKISGIKKAGITPKIMFFVKPLKNSSWDFWSCGGDCYLYDILKPVILLENIYDLLTSIPRNLQPNIERRTHWCQNLSQN